MSERELPMTGSGDGRADAAGEGPDGGPEPRQIEASSLRLVSTLTIAGAIAGLVIVLVHQWAEPRIEAHRARVLSEAVVQVLGQPERYETAFLVDGAFTVDPPASADTTALERVYVGYDGSGRPVGVAVAGEKPGFQDVIGLIFGYDPAADQVLGMKVLESKETPGLGDKIEKDSAFVGAFRGVAAPIEGVKPGAGDGSPDEVDMITGATISSRTVIEIVNRRVGELREPLMSWWAGSSAGRAVAGDGARGGGDR